MRRRARLAGCVSSLLLLLMTACGSPRLTSVSQYEDFDSAHTHSRSFRASDARTCEAARRALLSQGYVIGTAGADSVQAKKSYQPQQEVHVEVEFRVVCAREGRTGAATLAFASALQDRYALRKSNSSASLGVGALGSVSLPFTASDDSLVKVASETITSQTFYDRFFALVERYLAGQPDAPPEEPARPVAAAPASPAASVPAVGTPAAAVPSPVAPPAPVTVEPVPAAAASAPAAPPPASAVPPPPAASGA